MMISKVERKLASRRALSKIEPAVESLFANGRLHVVIASQPCQSGRADWYILEARNCPRSCRLFEEDGAEEVDCRLCRNLNALVCGLHSKKSLCIHNLWSESQSVMADSFLSG